MPIMSDLITPEQLNKLLQLKQGLSPLQSIEAEGANISQDMRDRYITPHLEQTSSNDQASTSQIPLPNGGLEGLDLQNFIYNNPGPKAIVGNNPNNPGSASPDALDSPDDAAEPTAARSLASAPTGSAPTSSKETPATPSNQPKDYLQQLMSKLYGPNMGQDALTQAIAQRDKSQLIANASRAGEGFAQALSKGAYKANNTTADSIDKNASNPMNDVMTRRKMIEDQLQAGLKASDLSDKEQLRDPTSPVSDAYREFAKLANPKLADNESFDNMSAEGVKQLLPGIDMMMKMDFMKMTKAQMNQQKQDQLFGNAKAEMTNKIATLGNRGAVKNAYETERLVDNAQALLDRYPDADKMPTQQVALFIDELTKIARGGTATEGGAKAIMPSTLQSNIANFMSKVGGTPTPAQLGAFLKENQGYLQDLKSNSQKFIGNVITPLFTGYNRKVRPEDLNEMKSQYKTYLDASSGKTQEASSKIKVSNGKETLLIDPSDLPHAQADGYKQVQ